MTVWPWFTSGILAHYSQLAKEVTDGLGNNRFESKCGFTIGNGNISRELARD
jgi:hypothetical protein